MLMTTFARIVGAHDRHSKSPATIGANKVNDWFVWNDSGTIRLSHGPDWTNDTTRSAGTALARVNGILLNNASITNGPAASTRHLCSGRHHATDVATSRWIYGDSPLAGSASNGVAGNAYNRIMFGAGVQKVITCWT